MFDLLTPPQGPRGGAKKCAVASPIHVSNSHTKFGWVSSKFISEEMAYLGQTDRLTGGMFWGS